MSQGKFRLVTRSHFDGLVDGGCGQNATDICQVGSDQAKAVLDALVKQINADG